MSINKVIRVPVQIGLWVYVLAVALLLQASLDWKVQTNLQFQLECDNTLGNSHFRD